MLGMDGPGLVSFELTPTQAVLGCICLGSTFIGSLYVKPAGKLGRNHPEVIKSRFIGVLLSSAIAAVAISQLGTPVTEDGWPLLRWLGVCAPNTLAAVIFPLFHMIVLYAGPILLLWMDDEFNARTMIENLRMRGTLGVIRDLILAPLTEEWVFRACMLPLLVPTFGWGYGTLACPLFFGLAHVHHVYESVHVRGLNLSDSLSSAAIQFSYTTLFGLYSSYCFLQTGHVIAPAVSHSFCNAFGVPNIQYMSTHRDRKVLLPTLVFGLLGFFALFPYLLSADHFDSMYSQFLS
eukprot:CFRG8357T1